jgi:hypothetical protein
MTSTQKLSVNVDGSTASFLLMPSTKADDVLPTIPHRLTSAAATNVNSSSFLSANGGSKQQALKTSPDNGYDTFADVDPTKAIKSDDNGRAQLGLSGRGEGRSGGGDDDDVSASDTGGRFCYSTPEHFVFWKFEINRALLPLKLVMFCFYGGELFSYSI